MKGILIHMKVLHVASLKFLFIWTWQLWSVVHALKEVKSTLCAKQHSAGGGKNDYYSKPLNEFKNSYFSAFAIQSPCLGLMQKIPFAFLLRAELCALMHTRITVTANLCNILLHYYHSWSPVQLITARDLWVRTCSATYVLCAHCTEQ